MDTMEAEVATEVVTRMATPKEGTSHENPIDLTILTRFHPIKEQRLIDRRSDV